MIPIRRAAGALRWLTFLACAVSASGAQRTVIVSRSTGKTVASDEAAAVIAERQAGTDDAAVVQAAIDAVYPGGHVTLRTGRYVFGRSVIVSHSTTITGGGRQTIVVPPSQDFAFRLLKRDNSRTIRWEVDGLPLGSTSPPKDCQWLLSLGERPVPHSVKVQLPQDCSPLLGIVVEKLTIDGEKRGKGIYLDHLAECALRDLWIDNTHAGAGLFIKDVWETSFDNIHFLGNGSPESHEASIVITAEGANNLHFDRVFVIFPNYIGMEIGAGEVRETPRLIFISHAMFHGWLPVPTVRPYDLIYTRNLDAYRGLVLRDTRLTNSGAESAYVNIEKGEVKIQGCVLGGGRGAYAIRVQRDGRLTASGNSFHPATASGGKTAYALYASGGEATFTENLLAPNTGPLWLAAARNSIISRNRFLGAAGGPRVRIGDDGRNGCTNVMVNENLFSARSEGEAVWISPLSKRGIEVRGNVYGSEP